MVNNKVDVWGNLWFTLRNFWVVEINMTVDELKKHYSVKYDSDLAKILKKTRGAVSKWRSNGIPVNTQAILQIQTNGQVKADLSIYKKVGEQ